MPLQTNSFWKDVPDDFWQDGGGNRHGEKQECPACGKDFEVTEETERAGVIICMDCFRRAGPGARGLEQDAEAWRLHLAGHSVATVRAKYGLTGGIHREPSFVSAGASAYGAAAAAAPGPALLHPDASSSASSSSHPVPVPGPAPLPAAPAAAAAMPPMPVAPGIILPIAVAPKPALPKAMALPVAPKAAVLKHYGVRPPIVCVPKAKQFGAFPGVATSHHTLAPGAAQIREYSLYPDMCTAVAQLLAARGAPVNPQWDGAMVRSVVQELGEYMQNELLGGRRVPIPGNPYPIGQLSCTSVANYPPAGGPPYYTRTVHLTRANEHFVKKLNRPHS